MRSYLFAFLLFSFSLPFSPFLFFSLCLSLSLFFSLFSLFFLSFFSLFSLFFLSFFSLFSLLAQDLGSHVISAILIDPTGVLTITLIQLQADRLYLTDSSSIKVSSQWDIRLGYVQLVLKNPEETAKFVEYMFGNQKKNKGCVCQDYADYANTKFLFLGSAPRDMRPSICFKYTANRSHGGRSSAKQTEFDHQIVCPGEILCIGIRSDDCEILNEKIRSQPNLSKILHLGCTLRLNQQSSPHIMSAAIPDSVLYDLCEQGKTMISKLQICVIPCKKKQ